LFCTAAIAQEAAPAARIVNPIDERQLVTLKGTVHPLANARNDRGAAPGDMQLDWMHLVLKRSNSQEAALRSLITVMHTPGTASYHKWLTPDAFGKQFGPTDQDITTVENWLAGHGFTVAKVNPGKQTIEFSGNVAQFSSAFHAQIHRYQVNGETHFANATDPQIPAALAPVVGGFVTLNNFRAKSYAEYMGKAQYDPKTDHATPEWTTGGNNSFNFVLAPQDYAVQYDLNPLYAAGTNGTGQTIAIINESNINIGLVNSFRSLFSLPVNPPQVIIDGNDPGVDGINNPDGANGASTEAYLDVEWAGAVAPNATIDLVIAADTALENGLTLAMEHAVYGNVAPVMSLSFGNCEANLGTFNTFLNSLWEQAAAQGITVMVSAGDSGSAGCDSSGAEYATLGQAVSGFASTPFNVAVGGTDFYYGPLAGISTQIGTYWNETPSNSTPSVSIKGVIPEQPWNDSQYGITIATQQNPTPTSTSIAAGSGGSSSIYKTKPAWQTGFGDTVRDLPDVSLFASNGFNASFYPLCAVDGDCQPVSSGGTVQISGVGGTSASSPAFAGIMALVNQKYGPQGQADFVLYPLSKQFPTAFHDVANGTNSVPCAFSATAADDSPNCIAASNPVTITDSNGNTILEGQIGTGTTAEYNAVAGYDEASGLGTVDANVLVSDWNKVTFTSTTTTLTPTSGTTFTHGTAFTFDGTVKPASGTATGSVALMTNSTEESQQGQGAYALSSGSFSGSTSTLPGGTYNIWGQYSGDGTNGASNSTPVSITVNAENSGIYFSMVSPTGLFTSTTTPGTSVDYGTQLNLSAQVAPTADVATLQSCQASTTVTCPAYTKPTGTIAFKDGSTALNIALINAEGDAEYNAPFSVGSHTVAASYSGDPSYNASTASAIAFTVVKDTPTISDFSSIQDSSNGDLVNGPNQPTLITIQVENTAQANSNLPVQVAAPTGSVTLSSTLAGLSGTATLSPGVDPSTNAVMGVATFSVPAGSVSGSYQLTATYGGDGNYNSASLANSPFAVETTSGNGGLTSTVAGTLSGSISPTTSVTISGTVTGQSGKAAPTGALYVYSSGNYPTGVNITPGTGDSSTFSIVLNSQTLFQGSNQITLQYFGDNTYNPSATVLTTAISNPLSDFTLIPETTIVPINVSGAGSGTDTINLASVNGFSGAVNLTCQAAAGVTCAISPSAPSLSGGGSSTATLTIVATASSPNLSYNVLVSGADSTGAYVHTLGIEAVVSGSSVTASFGLSATPANLSLTAGATSGNTSTITVAPIGGSFTSTVDLTCAVTGSPSGATSPATCSLAAPSVASGSGTDVVTIASTSTTTAGAYAITVTGVSGTITQTATVNVTITAAAAAVYTVAATSPAGISPGSTATSTVTVASTTGYAGTATISCALTASPTGATDVPTCTGGAGTVTLSSSATTGTTTVTVSTTGATAELVYPRIGGKGKGWAGAGGGAILALLALLWIPARRRNLLSMLGVVILMAALGSMAACGGGGSGGSVGGGGGGGGGGSTGTTAGSYTFTVTATGSPAQASGNTTTFTLTVN
jgi:subtilase family serine protease